MNRLSPATLAGMQAWEGITAEMMATDEADIEVEAVTVYECPDCNERHDFESDAIACCEHVRLERKLGKPDPTLCPVCGAEHSSVTEAADCCLWKDLDAYRRYRIGQMVEGGVPWRDAIEKWTT